MAALNDVLSSSVHRKTNLSNHSKQVKFASNPVMITTTTPSGSAATANNGLTSDPRTLSHHQPATSPAVAPVASVHSKNASKVRGTIPVTDFSDPKRVKNVLVSTPSNENSSDHTYASKADTSSSDDSSSSSDTESMETTPPAVSTQPKPSGKGRGRPRKQVIPVSAEPIPPLKSILKPTISSVSTVGDKITFEKVKRRGRGCGQCTGCLREDCGSCCYCLDKPKFGGPGKKKQRCALRVCANFVSHASSGFRGVVSKGLPLSPDEAAKLLSQVGTSSGVTLRPSVNKVESKSHPSQESGGVSNTRSTKQEDMVKCVMCARERKQSLTRSSKFCSVKCLKDWELLYPGEHPDTAEPLDIPQVPKLLSAGSLDKPVQRVLKNLQIDMALPGEKKHDQTLSELLEIASSIVEGGITTTTVTTGNKRANQITAGETATKKTKTSAITSIPPTSPVVTSSPANPMSTKMTIKRKEQLNPAEVGSWSTEEVERYFESTGECSPIAPVLRDQEIDGEALLLLSHDSLVKCLGMKLGPALKVMTHVDKLKLQASSSF